MTVKEFILKYKEAAQIASSQNGIHYLAILTQAAHESAFGKYAFGNNFFGIKPGKNWTGKTQLLKTNEYSINPNLKFPEIISKTQETVRGKLMWHYRIRDYFRAYDTAQEGFLDHGQFLINNKRYATALLFKDQPEKFFLEIAKAGYATDPAYCSKLIEIYKKIKNEVNEDTTLKSTNIL